MIGDEATFAATYHAYYRHLHAYCRRRTAPDRVDDAVADIFLVAWRRIDEVPQGDATLPWLYGVAYHVLGHQFRSLSRRRRLRTKLTAIGVDAAAPVDELVVQRHESHQVLDALAQLRPIDREILRLSLWEELAHADIARVLGISIDAVKQRLSRARKSLTHEFNRLESNGPASTPAAQKGGTS